MRRLVTLSLLTVSLVAAASAAIGAETGYAVDRASTNLNNPASLQRGARLFVNYCLSCHSAEFMRYQRMATDLQLTDEQVEEYLIFTGAEIGDTMQVAMPAEASQRWFGATPPDLSVVSRSRGVDWLYTFLRSYYPDPSRPSGWNNMLFENTSMPHVLWELQGTREPLEEEHEEAEADHGGEAAEPVHGAPQAEPERWKQISAGVMTEEEYDAAILDLVTFLEYVGEPSKIQRESLGVWVLLFLAFFALLAYLLKHEYWKDVH